MINQNIISIDENSSYKLNWKKENETDKAIAFSGIKGKAIWLPKSQISFDEINANIKTRKGEVKVVLNVLKLPEWLFNDKIGYISEEAKQTTKEIINDLVIRHFH